MRDIEEKQTYAQTVLVRTSEVVINWRRALTEVLCKNDEQTISDRNWARLTTRLRDLCPETRWTFINDNNSVPEKEDIEALHVWLEAMVADPAWPFPESIIITRECHNKEHSWKMLFPRSVTKLPFVIPPHSLTVTPYYDKHLSGWHIRAIDSFTINQVGEA